MNDVLEFAGAWFLPEEPERRVAGTLRFSPEDGANLELLGLLPARLGMAEAFRALAAPSPEIILGVSTNGEEITLSKCLRRNTHFSSGGVTTNAYFAHVVFVGALFRSESDLRFRRLYLSLSDLDEWTDVSGFQVSNTDEPLGMTVTYNRPESIHLLSSQDYRLYLDFSFGVSPLTRVQKELRIQQHSQLRVEVDDGKDLDELLSIGRKFQNLLTIAVARPVHPIEVWATGEDLKQPIHVLRRLLSRPILKEGALHPAEMLFTFQDISEQRDQYLSTWFTKAEALEPVHNLFFGTLYNPLLYEEQRFLSMVQCLEVYHRSTAGTPMISREECRKLRKDMLRAVPAEHRQWIGDRLNSLCEPSLRDRLRDLLQDLSELADTFVTDREDFIGKVVDTRNYLTHYSRSPEGVVQPRDLYYLTQQLKVLVAAFLLHELGFTVTHTKQIFERNRQYRFHMGLPY